MTSTLEDMEGAFLDAPCMAALGDSIRYMAVGGSFVAMLAYVDHAEGSRPLGTGEVIEQDMSVQVLRSDVPVRPSSACRVTVGKVPGKTFKPVNVRRDTTGQFWEFELALVNE